MRDDLADRLRTHVQEIPDFPKPGLMFRDLTPILKDPALFRETVDALADAVSPHDPELVGGIESRGFLFSSAVAYRLARGLIPIRWAKKLPLHPKDLVFQLEYEFDAVEVHRDAFDGGRRVVLVDDLLATGSTLRACADLVAKAGGTVAAVAVVAEVEALEGRQNLPGLSVVSLCRV